MREKIFVLMCLCCAVFAGACDDDAVTPNVPDEPAGLPIDSLIVSIVAGASSFVAGETITVTVTVENPTASTVVYGIGSSTCWLNASTIYDGEELPVLGGRFCTMDCIPWSLEPYESRTESGTWSGNYYDPSTWVVWSLPAGEYELTGIAGETRGASVTVEIVD